MQAVAQKELVLHATVFEGTVSWAAHVQDCFLQSGFKVLLRGDTTLLCSF